MKNALVFANEMGRMVKDLVSLSELGPDTTVQVAQ